MKKFAALMCVIAFVIGIAGCAWGSVSLSAFPDPVFREYLKSYDRGWVEYDSNSREIRDAYGNTIYFGKDNGILDDKEIEGITSIYVYDVSSLKGIENLTALEYLHCNGTLTELDLSRNTKLTHLECYGNLLTELDLSHNTNLTELNCWDNKLTKLDLSGHTALKSLRCNENPLTELNLSDCTSLAYVNCSLPPPPVIALPSNVAYTGYDLGDWRILFPSLKKFTARNCTAMQSLFCECEALTEFDISGCTSLEYLYYKGQKLSKIDLSKNTALKRLDCDRTPITELDLSHNTALELLFCYDSQLKSLDVSGCAVLETLWCGGNQLTELDVSHCVSLKTLSCYENQLKRLDLSKNTALNILNCSKNQLTELDLSYNAALQLDYRGVDCHEQKSRGIKMKKTSKGYEVNIKDYVSHIENIDASSIYPVPASSPNPVSYDKKTGIAIFSEPLTSLRYCYITHAPEGSNGETMYVDITNPLSVAPLESSYGDFWINSIIYGMTDNSYLGGDGNPLTESAIRYCDYIWHGKEGLTADGNSRLIIRAQTDKPGTVSFSLKDDIGLKLESLSRSELTASAQLDTTEFDSDIHQVSAVLIAPERFPEDKNFPSDTFKVHVKFTDEDGEITEDDLELRIEAAPVILIPGMFNPGGFTNVFAVASVLASAVNPGDSQHTFGFIQQELLSRGFKKEHIAFWDHGGRKGIKNLIGHDYNHLFTILANMFESYAKEGIVCTKADVIAHGMGGLIIREFLNETNKSDADDANNWSARSYKQGMIHRVINIAVPHMGTPLANVLLGDFSVLNNVAVGNDALAQTCLWLLHNKYLKIYSEPFLKEIAVGSDFLNNLPLPANVPMHFVYGDVKGYLDSFENIKDTAFMLFNLAKLVKSAGKNIAKYQKLSEYSDFVQFSNTLQNVNPKTDLELLKTINNLDDKILLRVASQQEAIIRDMMTNNEIRSVALSFAEMAYQNPQVTGFFQILGVVSDGLEALNPVTLAFNLYFSMQRVIFSGQAHDMFVPVDSAVTMLREYSTGFPEPGTNSWMDWRFRHSTLCQQGDVAYAVATILRRNDMNDFAILKKSVQLTDALPQQVKVNSTAYDELNLEGIDLENICATNFALTANQSTVMIPEVGTSVVKFTASAKNLVSNDVQLVIHKDGLDRTFPMYTDNGKSFEINIEFTSSDSGAMFAYCYTPNDKKLYVSNTFQFSCIRNLDNVDITEISFFGKDTLYTNVNSEIPAGLFAVDSDGRYYDVSSPLVGTQWKSDEVARVNDNGCIFGLSEGTTTLTATFRGLTASVNVEVAAVLVEEEEDTPPEITTEALSNGITNQP